MNSSSSEIAFLPESFLSIGRGQNVELVMGKKYLGSKA